MNQALDARLVLLSRPKRLDELIRRFNSVAQARFYIEHLGADFSDYLLEDTTYKTVHKLATKYLARFGRVQLLDRGFLPNYLFGPEDIVVALGQDGLVANALKYLDGQWLLGVNPDPLRWEGVLLPFKVPDLPHIMPAVLTRGAQLRRVTMAQANLNNGETLLGVNDIFVGPKTHFSARYNLRHGQQQEQHSSSGIIVSTGLGSSGWLRSIVAGATSISDSLRTMAETIPVASSFGWDADYLRFSVREPWPSKTTKASLTTGKITAEMPLEVVSQMPENGVIFSDGIEQDFLQFNAGSKATIGLAKRQGLLVVG